LKSLGEEFAEELSKEVAVNDNGNPQLLTIRRLLVTKLLRGAVSAKLNELLRTLDYLQKLGAFDEMEKSSEDEGYFSDEDLRLLERVREEMAPYMCPTCHRLTGACEDEDGNESEPDGGLD
jgi:hypothetical protein